MGRDGKGGLAGSTKQKRVVMQTPIAPELDSYILRDSRTGRSILFYRESRDKIGVWLDRAVLSADHYESIDISLQHMGKNWDFHSVHIPPEKKVVLPIEVAREVWRVLCLPCIVEDGTEEPGWSLYRA